MGKENRRLLEKRIPCCVAHCKEPSLGHRRGHGRFCSWHLGKFLQHGDALKASYSIPLIQKYAEAASAWLDLNKDNPAVKQCIWRIRSHMTIADRVVKKNELAGMSAIHKAYSLWPMLRSRKVSEQKILASILGVKICVLADLERSKIEFRRVQISRILCHIAGGSYKSWINRGNPSENRAKRILGQSAEICTIAIKDKTLRAILMELGQQPKSLYFRKVHLIGAHT